MLPYGEVPFDRHSLIIQEKGWFVNTFFESFLFFWKKEFKAVHTHLPCARIALKGEKKKGFITAFRRCVLIITNVGRLVNTFC